MNESTRRDIVAKHLHDARCSGCVNGRYSGEHRQGQVELDYPKADALLAELDRMGDPR